MIAALEWGEWSPARPGRTLPPGKTRYPLYKKLGGPKGRSRRAENLVPTGIRSRTVQPYSVAIPKLLIHCNNGCKKVPQCHVVPTVNCLSCYIARKIRHDIKHFLFRASNERRTLSAKHCQPHARPQGVLTKIRRHADFRT